MTIFDQKQVLDKPQVRIYPSSDRICIAISFNWHIANQKNENILHINLH